MDDYGASAARLGRAMVSLTGLSVGDAFGERFFIEVFHGRLEERVAERVAPEPPWGFTDDTQMAISIVDTLREHGRIDQDYLALSLAHGFHMGRGYGPAMIPYLRRIREGEKWSEAAPRLFNGQGSWGNGSAMRIAPLGAYFADDLWLAADQAALSAVVTHAHPEAVAGAQAVAVAAGLAWQYRMAGERPDVSEFLDTLIPYVPRSKVLDGIIQARALHSSASVRLATSALGNGIEISCPDTVPFDLWCAARSLGSYEDALWDTVSAGGDIDTNCAIVGGIVVMYGGVEGIPAGWLAAREAVPDKPEGWVPEFE